MKVLGGFPSQEADLLQEEEVRVRVFTAHLVSFCLTCISLSSSCIESVVGLLRLW